MEGSSVKKEIIVGLFVLFGLVVLLGMTFAIRGGTGFDPLEIRTEFRNVAGLEIGSPVLVSGFRTGRVVNMEPDYTEDGEPMVIVVSRVSRSVPIFRDARARLVQQGFIGDKRLEIDPGNRNTGEIEDGATIVTTPPLELSDLFAEGQEIVDDLKASLSAVRGILTDQERFDRIDATIVSVQESTERINRMLEQNEEGVAITIANIQSISEKGIDVADRAERVLAEAETSIGSMTGVVEETFAELRETARDLSTRIDSLLAEADGVGDNANELLRASRRQIDEVAEELKRTSDQINQLLGSVNTGEGTVGRLVKDPRPFEDLQISISALRNFLVRDETRPYNRAIPYRRAPATSDDGDSPSSGTM